MLPFLFPFLKVLGDGILDTIDPLDLKLRCF